MRLACFVGPTMKTNGAVASVPSVGGHQVLPADGQQRLPSHGHVATHRVQQRIIDITRTATDRHFWATGSE